MYAIAANSARMRSTSGSVHPVSDTNPPPDTPRTLLVQKHGKPHHPFPRSLAPYPVNYEKTVLDADALDLAFRLQIFEGSPTSIPDIRLDNPKTHPRRCLDLGCASGDWILAASRSWPNATFVGVDLVIGHQIPVHLLDQSDYPHDHPLTSAAILSNPEPQSPRARSNTGPGNSVQPYSSTSPTSSPPLGSRIRWVQANFLKPLPFGDGEFDYVHISGIARGVPEDKWDSLFAEVSRVLAVNGHLEMLEEDVVFPILPSGTAPFLDSGGNGSIAGLSETTSTSRTSVSSFLFFDSNSPGDERARRSSFSANRFLAAAAPKPPRPLVPSLSLNTKLSPQSYPGDSRATATNSTRSAEFPFVSPTPHHRNADGSSADAPTAITMKVPEKRCADPAIPRGWDGPPQVKRCMDPAIPSGWDGPSQVKRCMDPAIPSGWDGPPEVESVGSSFLPSSGKDAKRPRTATAVAASLMALSIKTPSLSFNPRSRRPTSAGRGSGRGSGRNKSKGPSDGTPPSSYPLPPLPNSTGTSRSDSSSLNRHFRESSLTMPDAPPSMSSIRHDHQILQTLFFSVYEGRFINTTPTAILPSLFNMYFQNVKVTPPIDFPTPPPPHAARETTRRDRRNTMQREWGSAGLEQSRGVTMNVSKSFVSLSGADGLRAIPIQAPHIGNTNNRVEVSPLAVDRSVKRVQSSPGLALDARNRSSSRNSSPFSATSISSGRSESPLSRNTSFLPTPVSVQQTNPHIESPHDITQHTHRYGATDHGLVSPDSAHQLHHSKSFVSVERAPAEEEEDAKLAIMGDGGYFPTEEDTAQEAKDGRTLSEFPSLASPRSERSIPRNDEVYAQQEKEDDFLLDVLQDFEIGGDEADNLDHLAAEELEIFDIIGRADEPPSCPAEISKRVYVRPRRAFAGQGMPVPPQLLEMDDLSMGVHLTRAWLSVVACKEAMWDELQRRAQTIQSPTKEPYIPDNEPGSPTLQRMTLLDEVEWVGLEKRMSSREKFELLFLRFEDDMRQWAAVGSAIPQKLSWIDPRYPNLGPVPLLSSKRTRVSVGLDDGCGPGRDGIIIPGVDVCRTLRVFTARKSVDRHSPGGNASKILGVL